jgi:hypothetical protein
VAPYPLPPAPAAGAAAGATWATDRAGAGTAPAWSGVAHSEQNFEPAAFGVLQVGQTIPNGAAHSVQNFAPARFSVPQFAQITIGG